MAVDAAQRALAAQHNADIPARKNAEQSATHAVDPAAEELLARAKAKRETRAAQGTATRERPGHSVTVPARKNPDAAPSPDADEEGTETTTPAPRKDAKSKKSKKSPR